MPVTELRDALAKLDGNIKVCVAYSDTAIGLNEFEHETFDVCAKGLTTSLVGQDEPVFRIEAWGISARTARKIAEYRKLHRQAAQAAFIAGRQMAEYKKPASAPNSLPVATMTDFIALPIDSGRSRHRVQSAAPALRRQI